LSAFVLPASDTLSSDRVKKPTMPLLIANRIVKRMGDAFLLEVDSFSIREGEQVVLAGSNGSGKSTLMRILAGRDSADGGEVHFMGEPVLGPDVRLAHSHPGVEYLSQHFELRKNYRLADELEAWGRVDAAVMERIVELCRIGHLMGRLTSQLSGGERQRAALARALSCAPLLLLLDEPFSNQDAEQRDFLRGLLDFLRSDSGIASLTVLHEPADILSMGDRIVLMREGRIIQQGGPKDVYHRPVDAAAAQLSGPVNTLDERAFRLLSGASEKTDGKWMLRPDGLRLASPGEGVAGTVESVRFFGGHEELRVRVSGVRLLVNVLRSGLSTGDPVHLRMVPGAAWRLPD
jgi:iron(III) transport system ATP-binding protein